MKSAGKRSMFRRTAWFNAFTSTSYRSVYGDLSARRRESKVFTTGPTEAPYDVQPESLAGLMKRNLDAWVMAKAAVEKARRS